METSPTKPCHAPLSPQNGGGNDSVVGMECASGATSTKLAAQVGSSSEPTHVAQVSVHLGRGGEGAPPARRRDRPGRREAAPQEDGPGAAGVGPRLVRAAPETAARAQGAASGASPQPGAGRPRLAAEGAVAAQEGADRPGSPAETGREGVGCGRGTAGGQRGGAPAEVGPPLAGAAAHAEPGPGGGLRGVGEQRKGPAAAGRDGRQGRAAGARSRRGVRAGAVGGSGAD